MNLNAQAKVKFKNKHIVYIYGEIMLREVEVDQKNIQLKRKERRL